MSLTAKSQRILGTKTRPVLTSDGCVVITDCELTYICKQSNVSETAPDGSVTKALQGLTTLANELVENSGIDSSINGWFDNIFGKWKTIVVTILGEVIASMGILVLCGCCLIPCV
ncbi:hypothetical protein J4Q44_G00045850 [Coregonus suidteri]|uniref:Uncharacterized protein n=1 Tax=Coregonus suidteri TaxID=861788 RepID=A0AAN8M6F3_9TELE